MEGVGGIGGEVSRMWTSLSHVPFALALNPPNSTNFVPTALHV